MRHSALFLLSFWVCSGSVVGQGYVNFDTKVVGARVFYVDHYNPGPAKPATGNDPQYNLPFKGQLYAAAGTGAPEAALQPVGTPLFFLGSGNPVSPNAGYLRAIEPVEVTPVIAGPATVQLRAWTVAESYEGAVALNNGRVILGKSATLNLAFTGNPGSSVEAVDLTGLQGFTMQNFIPEPSTYMLMGIGAFLLAGPFKKKFRARV